MTRLKGEHILHSEPVHNLEDYVLHFAPLILLLEEALFKMRFIVRNFLSLLQFLVGRGFVTQYTKLLSSERVIVFDLSLGGRVLR